jgi:hypothetical protein
VLVPVKIFQFQDMHYENRFLGTFQGHSKRPNSLGITEPAMFADDTSLTATIESLLSKLNTNWGWKSVA